MTIRIAATVCAVALVIACSACSSSAGTTSPAGAPAAPGAVATTTPAAPDASTSSAGPVAGAPDPCTLATAAEIGSVFGGTVSDGAPDTSADAVNPTCDWQVTGSNFGGSGTVDIFVPNALQDATRFADAHDGLPGAVDVPGIGDGAFYSSTTAALSVLKGNTVVTVQAIFIGGDGNTSDPTAMQADVTALAKTVGAAL